MIGDDLKFHRQRIGLIPEDLARLAGVDVSIIHRWESGRLPIKRAIRLRVLLTKLREKQRQFLTGVEDSRQWENWLARHLIEAAADEESSPGG